MTFTELRYLVALAQTKHFGKAAAQCHVSQPTLSVAINKLELQLGVKLFERHHHDIRITDIGQKIVEQAQRALEEVSRIHVLAADGKSQLAAPLRIGGIYTVAPYLFPLLIPKLKKRAPTMPLMIQEGFTKPLREKLQSGELDAIFVALPFSGAGFVTRPLYEEPLVVLMPKDHRLAKHAAIDPKELKSENVLLIEAGNCFRDQVLKICRHCYQSTGDQTITEGSSLETLRHMVASGIGITILPSSAAGVSHYQTLLCCRPFKKPMPQRTIALAWRESFPRPKAIDVIIRAISDCHLHQVCLLPERA